MKLHLVGGFLGSGKTTAIIHAARSLMKRGLRVGVITNDQGKYLVDTAFFKLADVPTVEVTGGCFCCNYTDLDQSLDQLMESTHPDVIFAESVGSCADLVATVVKPLLTLKQVALTPTSFSVFADVRLLRRRLFDRPMPFSEDVVYIFDKQIEEAGLVVINKADLVQADEVVETETLLRQKYPAVGVLSQSSLSETSVADWLDLLERNQGLLPVNSLEIDYQRYGHGEAQLAWLDEEVVLHGGGEDVSISVRRVIRLILDALSQHEASIGHLKFFVKGAGVEEKISFPTLSEAGWEKQLAETMGNEARVLINARVEMDATALRTLFREALKAGGNVYEEEGVTFFHPKQPNPIHRL
jgi:G3E family GTPase